MAHAIDHMFLSEEDADNHIAYLCSRGHFLKTKKHFQCFEENCHAWVGRRSVKRYVESGKVDPELLEGFAVIGCDR